METLTCSPTMHCYTSIGYETAKQIVRMNGTVIMACRSLEKANAAKAEILKSLNVSPSKIIVKKLDLCGFDSVKKFVKVILGPECDVDAGGEACIA
jgi:short-subunit dehydrogenase